MATPTTTVVRVTVTARYRAAVLPAIACTLVAVAGGCGGGGYGSASAAPSSVSATAAVVQPLVQPLSLLGSAPAPAGWHLVRAAGGATLPYPPSWRALAGDRGTVSAALLDGHGHFVGYLNLTPRQGAESESNWASFRPDHNREEGDTHVHVIASRKGLRLGGGRASCVEDSYSTSTDARYVELACLIAGQRPVVALGAAPPGNWRAQAPVIARALSAVTL
jgi:hypothetical protein